MVFIISEDVCGVSWVDVKRKISEALPVSVVKDAGIVLDEIDVDDLFWMIGLYGWDNVVVFSDGKKLYVGRGE